MRRRRLVIAAVAALIAIAAAALGVARLVSGEEVNLARDHPSIQKAALEGAILRYENRVARAHGPHRPAQVRAVDCRQPAPRFRGNPAFRCMIRFKEAGAEFNCFALAGRALYQVGGCYDPVRDLGAGKGRLLSRSSRL